MQIKDENKEEKWPFDSNAIFRRNIMVFQEIFLSK